MQFSFRKMLARLSASRTLKWGLVSVLAVMGGGMAIGSTLNAAVDHSTTRIMYSSQFKDGKFHNMKAPEESEVAGFFNAMGKFMFGKSVATKPDVPIPVKPLTAEQLDRLPESELSIVRFGHSTILFKLQGEYWLTDPVFSERASPFTFVGPKRFHQPPMSIEKLPDIKGVIISHNHYDHLDKASIKQLDPKVAHFVVPLGIKAQLLEWGVPEQKVVELDWWNEFAIDDVLVVSTPAQHFSGRGLTDRNETLWSSWVVKGKEQSIFFSGDTGYFDGFKMIGEQYGPFDVAFIETGAYNEGWAHVHMMPEQSLQAHLDVNATYMFPIHNCTFDLSLHSWYDPLEQITTLAAKEGVQVLTPKMGQQVIVMPELATVQWWKPMMPVAKKEQQENQQVNNFLQEFEEL